MADRERDDLPVDLIHQLLEQEDKLIRRVEQLLQDGQLRAPSEIAAHPAPTAGLDDPIWLTEREAQVLRLLVTGRTNRQIGAELHLVSPTVRNYLSRIYRKLGVTTRTQAAIRAIELGLSGDGPATRRRRHHPAG